MKTLQVVPELQLPAVVAPSRPGEHLVTTILENHVQLRNTIASVGAVLFRGFDITGVDGFTAAIHTLSGPPLDYTERSSPRTSLSGKVFTSTDYPQTEAIFLHNECSYQIHWPLKLYFHCLEPALTRGATPLADVREVLRRIDPSVVEEFRARRWMYVRNFGEMGGSWQYFYNTDNRAGVESYCRSQGIEVEWIGPTALRTRAVRDALHTHPVTGEEVWFNHATFFHVDTLPPAYGEEMLDMFGEENLPSNTYYGDGGRIPRDVVRHLQEAYLAAQLRFDWKRGDILVIDNMLTAHGREPYTGARRVAVAMAEASNQPVGAVQ
jgi:alpha-ketoglutarate-dependent taurine dioxygenase